MLRNKVAIITGGSRGIGRAISIQLLKNGATVINIFKKNIDAANEMIQVAKNYPGEIINYQIDIIDFSLIQKLFRQIKNNYSQIDILINNAGIYKNGRIGNISNKDCVDIINTNLIGLINCTQAVSRIMIAQKFGFIINISSIAAVKTFPGLGVYSASKAGVIAFSNVLNLELSQFGINIKCIAPGPTNTDVIKKNNLDFTNIIEPEIIADAVVEILTVKESMTENIIFI